MPEFKLNLNEDAVLVLGLGFYKAYGEVAHIHIEWQNDERIFVEDTY